MTDLGKADNLVDALFGLELEEEFKCDETEECKISTATAKKLICNIQGGAGSNTQASDERSLSSLFNFLSFCLILGDCWLEGNMLMC